MEFMICFWLIPAEPTRTYFSDLIRQSALQFDAPIFEPHVTIYVTNSEHENPEAVLEKVLKGCQPFRLTIVGLDYSEKFTKTLFVQLAPDPALPRLSENLRRASVSPKDYELNPHLSLIYKEMEGKTKRRLASSIILPFTEVAFDTVKAIISPGEIKSREDVEAWRVVAEQKLGR